MSKSNSRAIRGDRILTAVIIASGLLFIIGRYAPNLAPRTKFWFSLPMFILLGLFTLLLLIVIVTLFSGDALAWVKKLPYRRTARANSAEFRQWIAEKVKLYRTLGFFEAQAHLNDHQLADFLIAKMVEVSGRNLSEFRYIPFLIAAFDETRVFHEDAENDLVCSPEGYEELLADYARISRGQFKPLNISTAIDEEAEKTTLSFENYGSAYEFTLELHDDWMDPTLIDKLNSTLPDRDFQFCIEEKSSSRGQDFCIVMLRSEERRRLREEAGWKV